MKYFLYPVIAVLLFTSCKKFLELEAPTTQVISSEVFSSDRAAESAAAGVYSEMTLANFSALNGGVTIYAGLCSDDLYNTTSNSDLDVFVTNNIPPTNSPGLGRLWNQSYRVIYHCNSVLEGLAKSISLTDSIRKRLRGEMLVTRALHFFYISSLFGDVPLTLTTDYRTNSIMARTTLPTIQLQLINDLEEARQLLGINYYGINKARPNKWSATALLSRIYLYKGEWSKAEMLASEIIQSGQYNLPTNLNQVFLPGSSETIWQLTRDYSNTAEGAAFVPASTTVRPTYALTENLIQTFELNDNRKGNWINKNVVGGITYNYPNKYKIRVASPISEYYVVLRLAELYLIRAEARAEQNNLIEAQQDINVIRQRSGLPAITFNDKPSILAAVAKERRVEFFAEWGHRWFDLIRTDKADQILGSFKFPHWQATDKLYPIPQSEIDNNPFLVQNPGY